MRPIGPSTAPAIGATTITWSASAEASTEVADHMPPSTYSRPSIRCGGSSPGTADDAATRSANGYAAAVEDVAAPACARRPRRPRPAGASPRRTVRGRSPTSTPGRRLGTLGVLHVQEVLVAQPQRHRRGGPRAGGGAERRGRSPRGRRPPPGRPRSRRCRRCRTRPRRRTPSPTGAGRSRPRAAVDVDGARAAVLVCHAPLRLRPRDPHAAAEASPTCYLPW